MAKIAFRAPVLFFVVLLGALPLLAHEPSFETKLKEIKDYSARAGRDWNVPGFAIAIVKDDKVVFAQGFGVRKLGETAPADADTLFAIASNTKAFTAAALGILVDEGKLKWNDPVTRYLPYFQMHDSYVTRERYLRRQEDLCR